MNQLKCLTFACVLLAQAGCEPQHEIRAAEGFVKVTGGRIWYQVIGEGGATPLLMLHGGPGFPSHYLGALRELSGKRPVILFDQLGCGRSDRISDTTLMTINNHIDQVNRLLTVLNIGDFYLYGHSWGTMLAVDYYLKNSSRVKGLILAGPCLSAGMWVSDADTLISTLPDSIQLILRNNINGITQDSIALASAIRVYSDNFYARKRPISAHLDSSTAQMGLNVYTYMWGANEFFATGTLKDYDRTADLGKINVPTLYVTGEFDSARPGTVRYYQSLTPGSRLVVINDAGHYTMHDNAEEDIKAISTFLDELDSGNLKR